MSTHNPMLSITIMLIASIFIGYYLSMTILLRTNKTDNRNKMYQSFLMGFWMALVELLMIGLLIVWLPYFTLLLLILIVGIALFTYLIYYQVGINENQFMLSMIEHHQMAIEMAKQVKSKTQNPQLIKIINDIITSQQQEIDEMYYILKTKGVPINITSLFY